MAGNDFAYFAYDHINNNMMNMHVHTYPIAQASNNQDRQNTHDECERARAMGNIIGKMS